MVLSWRREEREAWVDGGATALAVSGHGALRRMLDESDMRYELIDGTIVVSPPARFTHEDLAMRIVGALTPRLPQHLAIVGSNYGVHYTGPEDDPDDPVGSWLLPDVQVVRADSPELHNRTPALLVVEVLSPSTTWKDLGRKREVYAGIGIPTYWVVDPVARELRVLSLRDGAYVQTAAGSRFELTEPYDVVVDVS